MNLHSRIPSRSIWGRIQWWATRGKKKFSINIAVMIGSYFIGQLSFTYTRGPLFENLFKNRPAKSMPAWPFLLFSEVNKSSENVFQNSPLPAFSSFDASAGCILTGLHTYKTNTIQMKKYNAKQIQCKSNTSKINTNQWTSTKPPTCFPKFPNPPPLPAKMPRPPSEIKQRSC